MTFQPRHLNVDGLTESAGGDPWQLNNTIQSGSPGEISELATAFYEAGVCTQDTSEEFKAAKQRFQSAWDRQDGGEHPINDSAEVKGATESLQLNGEQMGRIAVELQNISASFAEAQRSGDISIGNLEAKLQAIDNQIDREIAIAAANGEAVDVSELEQAAIDQTRQALQEVQAIRDAYSDQLDQSQFEMAAEGYTPDSTKGVDGEGGLTPEAQAQSDAERYNSGQRAADEALVHSPGPWTPEKRAAAGRLRDYATVTDPNANPEAARYAGERLNDYYMSQFTGPLPVDPILGRDARARAQFRQEWQRLLEQGLNGSPPLSPDQATAMLDMADAQGRQIAIESAVGALQSNGMSEAGARGVVDDLARGVPWSLVAEHGSQTLNGTAAGLGAVYNSSSDGNHYKPDILMQKDAQALADIGKKLGLAGKAVDLASLGYDLYQGAASGERFGTFVGGAAAGGLAAWGATVAAGSVFGPGGTIVAVVVASALATKGGEMVGSYVGSQFDK
jgi:hypothetical protein